MIILLSPFFCCLGGGLEATKSHQVYREVLPDGSSKMRHLKSLFISLWGRPLLKSHSVVDPTRRSIMDPARVLKISNTPMVSNINESNAARTLHPRTDSMSICNPSYLIHKGRAVDMIKRCVSIEGLSLAKGWTPQATQAFMLAIG